MELSLTDRKLLRSEFSLCEARNVVDRGVVASIDFAVHLHKHNGEVVVYEHGDPKIAFERGDKVEFVKWRK